MEWSGRAPAPAAREAGEGGRTQRARHVTKARYCNRRDWHRYWQELVPRGGARQAWRNSVAAEVVAWTGRNAARQPAALPDRHGGLRRGASSQPQTSGAWPDARLIPAMFPGIFWCDADHTAVAAMNVRKLT